jgi:hypothetical protein
MKLPTGQLKGKKGIAREKEEENTVLSFATGRLMSRYLPNLAIPR